MTHDFMAIVATVTLSSVKTVVEIAAIGVGGAWTYILFIKGRGRFPRAGLTHEIERREISTGKVLLRLRVEITNDGPVVLNIRDATFRVQQVLPLSEELEETLSRTGDLVRPKELDVNWPLVAEREHSWPRDSLQIEPGERDEIVCGFFVDDTLQTVEIYSYFANESKPNQDIGWRLTTLYDFKRDGDEPLERTVQNLAGKERGP
jgi:hypothetical protein